MCQWETIVHSYCGYGSNPMAAGGMMAGETGLHPGYS